MFAIERELRDLAVQARHHGRRDIDRRTRWQKDRRAIEQDGAAALLEHLADDGVRLGADPLQGLLLRSGHLLAAERHLALEVLLARAKRRGPLLQLLLRESGALGLERFCVVLQTGVLSVQLGFHLLAELLEPRADEFPDGRGAEELVLEQEAEARHRRARGRRDRRALRLHLRWK